MKTLVAYLSETGNTEKVAQAIFECIPHSGNDLLPIENIVGCDEYDLIFCGFPVQAHSVPPKAQNFIRSIPKDKKVAFFATHGSLRGGERAVSAFHQLAGIGKDLKILGTFGARGKVRMALLDALSQKPEHAAWVDEARTAATHPDEADLHDAREFAKDILLKARHG